MEELIVKRLFGLEEHEYYDIAILIPLANVYYQFIEKFEPIIKNHGMWESAIYVIKNKRIIIINTIQGPGMKDAVYYLRNYVTKYYFTGWCGAIHESLSIGNIVTVNCVQNKSPKILFVDGDNEFHLKNVKCFTIDCFYEEEAILSLLKKEKCDVIDMETYYFIEALKKVDKLGEILLIVSDQIIEKPFYTITRNEYKSIIKNTLKAIALLVFR